jgi:hypothetical protein
VNLAGEVPIKQYPILIQSPASQTYDHRWR